LNWTSTSSVGCRRGESIDADDVEMFRGWKVALEAGLPEEAMLQLVRVYSDSLGRVAEAEARLFHFYVHERLREGAHSTREVVEKTEEATQRMRVLAEPAILYFHRKGMAAALRDDMLLHVAEYCGQTPTGEATAQMRLAVVFLDPLPLYDRCSWRSSSLRSIFAVSRSATPGRLHGHATRQIAQP
jgi:hypothetical protein